MTGALSKYHSRPRKLRIFLVLFRAGKEAGTLTVCLPGLTLAPRAAYDADLVVLSRSPSMNTRFAALSLLVLALLQACGGNESSTPAATAPASTPAAASGTTANVDTKFQDLEGKPLELSAYAGKKVFLNYWATWCAPCIREIPSIGRAAAELEDENYVFLFASDESLDTINDFLLDREFSGNFIKLNKFFGAWGINAVPSSELYDEKGQHLMTWSGAYEWDSAEMLDAIRNGTAVGPQLAQ